MSFVRTLPFYIWMKHEQCFPLPSRQNFLKRKIEKKKYNVNIVDTKCFVYYLLYTKYFGRWYTSSKRYVNF